MAMVDATRELEPEARPIGWDGRTLRQMLDDSEREFAETGSYTGLTGDLAMKSSDPIGYEKLFARLRGGLVSARETALNISASPIVRELGELCFALYTPEGDSTALARDHRPRPHDVGRDQVHGPLRLRGEPGDPPWTSSPTTTRRSAMSTTRMCRPSSRSSGRS